jgi:putative CocE/NonD family hydrolase
MKIATSLPFEVEEIEHVWIEMRDGTRLSARVWLPKGAAASPFPAILEYIPYRKRDFTAQRDAVMHPYFAGYGYASVRVDIRGSGESEGVLTDEYLPLEQEDGVEILQWIAGQPWCDGNVGMIGISWGGFNSLQIAALRPPELKAVMAVCATDDRYADDIHHMGGCLLGDNLSWASVMFAYNSLPPDPQIVGERWREMWLRRLEESGLWLDTWLGHQRRDA